MLIASAEYISVQIIHALITTLGPEIWNITEGRITHKGKAAVIEDAFIGAKSPKGGGSKRELNWLQFGGPKPEDTNED